MIILVFLGSCLVLAVAYFWYGRFLEQRLEVDNARPVPSSIMEDGVDYVPTENAILFGHHFSSIAGAGPIVGPIIAGLAFGWGPALLWIILGSIFIGGVHDFSSLIASIRHKARSIGEICRELLNPAAFYMFLIFIWFTLVYVLIVFLDLTALSFAPLEAVSATTEAQHLQVQQGGAVATASVFYVILAFVFGFLVYKLKMPVFATSLFFLPLIFVGLWVGQFAPLSVDKVPLLLGSSANFWKAILLVYCFAASILPVWILLQPRDYLASFLLYTCLVGGGFGLLASGLTGEAPVHLPFFKGLSDPQLGFIFPALFITVACGAVSGFHSIVASGTTSKQLKNEGSARKIGFGSMLVEAILGVLALGTVMILQTKPTAQPVGVFANGFGHFATNLGLSQNAATTFGLMAVSTFLLTTLDTCTRLCRFIFEEIFSLKGWSGRILGTVLSLALPAVLVFQQLPGADGKLMPAWKAIWPAFGTTNQLMAALALLVVYAWLKKEGKKNLYVFLPMVFMFATSITSLTMLTRSHLFGGGSVLVGGICLVLDLLAIGLLLDTFWNLDLRLRKQAAKASGTGGAHG